MTHLTTLAVARARGTQIPGDYVFFFLRRGHFWARSTELPSCHPSGAQNIKVAAAFIYGVFVQYTSGSDYYAISSSITYSLHVAESSLRS